MESKQDNRTMMMAAERAAAIALGAGWLPAPLLIWPFSEAPAELQALSDNGGDEDWLAIISPALAEKSNGEPPFFMFSLGFDTCLDPQVVRLGSGVLVVIGAHA